MKQIPFNSGTILWKLRTLDWAKEKKQKQKKPSLTIPRLVKTGPHFWPKHRPADLGEQVQHDEWSISILKRSAIRHLQPSTSEELTLTVCSLYHCCKDESYLWVTNFYLDQWLFWNQAWQWGIFNACQVVHKARKTELVFALNFPWGFFF